MGKITLFMALLLSNCFAYANSGEADYTVLKDEQTSNIKRSLEVSLKQKVSEADLKQIALTLKGNKQFERTFIGYVINSDEVKGGYWATTHFNPQLEVRILGMTLEDDLKAKADAESDERDVVSTWKDERPYIGSKITLYKVGDSFKLEIKYKDGSSSTDDVTLEEVKAGKKLVNAEENSLGEYFLMNKKGELEFWSANSGNYYTAKAIE